MNEVSLNNATVDHFFVIDVGGSRIKGFDSVSEKIYQAPGIRHSHALTRDLISAITEFFPDEVKKVDLIVLSLAAIPRIHADLELIAAALYQRVRFSRIIFSSDTNAASHSVSQRADLTIAIGTGLTASINKGSHNFELSGLGYLIGDEGSGFWIGRQGLNAALRAVQNIGEPTELALKAVNFYGVEPNYLADHIHQLPNPVTQIAAFTPLVIAAAESGDLEALRIIEEAVAEVVNIIHTAKSRADIETVSLIGGAIPVDEFYYSRVIEASKDLNVDFIRSEAEPLSGARKIAQSPTLQENLTSILVKEISPKVWVQLFFLTSEGLLAKVANSQNEAISQSIELVASALEKGKIIHTFGTGHSHLLAEEIFYRAGGLAAIFPILDERLMLHKDVVTASQNERLPDLASQILKEHSIASGDVVFVISNSGGNLVSIELLKKVQAKGAKVIALTSINHASSSLARSREVQKIHQLADAVLDNCGAVGDATISLFGVDTPIGPTSTIIGGAILHAIIVGVVAELPRRNVTPDIFLSSNVADGDKVNSALFEKYRSIITLYS